MRLARQLVDLFQFVYDEEWNQAIEQVSARILFILPSNYFHNLLPDNPSANLYEFQEEIQIWVETVVKDKDWYDYATGEVVQITTNDSPIAKR